MELFLDTIYIFHKGRHELSIYIVYNEFMKYQKGSSVGIGVIVGFLIGILTANAVTLTVLGLVFGILGEYANKKKRK